MLTLVLGSAAAGFAVARLWFHKEITVGKAVIVHYKNLLEARARQFETSIKADVGKVEATVEKEVNAAEAEVKKL